MTAQQPDLFGAPADMPEGLAYSGDIITVEEEAFLAGRIAGLPFKAFQFHGFEGNRRTVSFGWRYGFDGSGLAAAEPIPDWLLPFRARAAAFAGLEPEALAHLWSSNMRPAPASAGTGTGRSSAMSSACRCSRRRVCASAASLRKSGSGSRSGSSRARPIFCADRRAVNGSIASRRWTCCATRSPSVRSDNRPARPDTNGNCPIPHSRWPESRRHLSG